MAIKYTEQQLLRFKNRQMLIMTQSIFSSLCMFYAGGEKTEQELLKQAMKLAEELYKTYPMEIDMVEVNRNKAKLISGDEPF